MFTLGTEEEGGERCLAVQEEEDGEEDPSLPIRRML